VPAPEHQPVVLIAEDDDNDVTMLRRAFHQLSFAGATQFVSDGEQAIAYLAGQGRFGRRAEFPMPDFLLLDLKMPRKNGFDVLAWIRGQPSLAQLRIVVLTTSDDLREVNRAYQLGAASFLVKPVNFTDFKDTVQALTNYWLSHNRAASLMRPDKSHTLQALTDAIRARYAARVLHIENVVVSLLSPDNTSWHHDVHVFHLVGHPRASKCFAWMGEDAEPVTVLESDEITSPQAAVRSFRQRPTA